jgi:hypothetical protein
MIFDELQDKLLLISMAVMLGIILIHYRHWKRERELREKKAKGSKGKA